MPWPEILLTVAEAQALLQKSLAVAQRSTNAWDQLPVLTPLARLLYEQAHIQEGLDVALQCAVLAERMGDQTAQCGCINLAGDGYMLLGDLRSAEQWYADGLKLAEAIGNIGVARELGDEGSMIYAAQGLKKVYARQGRTADALAITDRWVLLKDSVGRMNGREELLLFRHREEELIDSLAHAQAMRMEAVVHAQQIATERTQRHMIIGVCIALAALALALWSRFRYARRANVAILSAQQQLVESEKRHEAEVVRTSIARDVHDQLGSDLTKLVMLSGEVRALATEDPSAMSATADDIERVAGDANRSLGDIVWAIDPHHDSLAGLTERVRVHCERMLKWSHVDHTIDCAHIGDDRSLDPATKRDIYLIVREALNNAVKYSKAQHISVEFRTDQHRIDMAVKDDGIGIGDAQRTTGHGLQNMNERAARIGLKLNIDSFEGTGCAVTLRGQLAPADQPPSLSSALNNY